MKYIFCILSLLLFACESNVKNSEELDYEKKMNDNHSELKAQSATLADLDAKMYLCRTDYQAHSTDPLGPLELLESIILQKNSKTVLEPLSLQKILFLRDARSPFLERTKELYFSWPEMILEKPVLFSHYNHRILDANRNIIYGTLINRLVAHDLENHYWFLPISSVFTHSLRDIDVDRGHYPYETLEDVNPDHIQEITFELGLKGDLNLAKKIQFHVAGPLPNLDLREMLGVDPMNAQNPEDFIKRVSKFDNGLLLRRTKIVNPTKRNLIVNYRIKPSSIVLQSYIQKTHSATTWVNYPVPSPGPEFYKSVGVFKLSTLSIRQTSRNEIETRDIHHNTWEHFTLKPEEDVILEWRAQPRDRAWFSLQTHEKVRHTEEDVTIYFDEPVFGVGPNTTIVFPKMAVIRKHRYSFIGAKVEGTIDFEMNYGHSFSTENTSGNLGQDLRPFENTSSRVRFLIGQEHSNAPNYKYQGFFNE